MAVWATLAPILPAAEIPAAINEMKRSGEHSTNVALSEAMLGGK